ncbi:parvalbumin alpha-like [Ruditapes philippinarum]|uniref:parvalbumin alpha-like n=1 Tax=Ruditapes philippinarum TaxID=129788 RepID=UPI00295BEE13|nr:parvalbumin alpha-like [Ruditapes philippinarum]
MAGTVSRSQAEAYWKKYNKDGNDVLTVEEVKQCLQEVYDSADDFDVKDKFAFFGQKEQKDLTKDEFIKGMMRTEKCIDLKKVFKAMDKDGNGSLSKEELESGLAANGFEGEVAKCIVEELEFDGDGKYNVDEFLETVAFSEQFAQTYGC